MFTTSNALLPPLPPHIGIFTVQCSAVNWLFQTFELHRQKCSIMAEGWIRSIGITFQQGFDKIQRNGESGKGGSAIKGISGWGLHWFKRRARAGNVLRIIHFPIPLKSASSQMEGFLDSSAVCKFEFIPRNRWKKAAADNMYWRIFPPSYFQSENFVGSYKLILM